MCGKDGNGSKYCRACKHDEVLFKKPDVDDCPICFLPMTIGVVQRQYQSCCGKTICLGCKYTAVTDRASENEARSLGNRPLLPHCCPFCRQRSDVTDDESLRRINHRIGLNDAHGYHMLAWAHHNGQYGLAPDGKKAFDLWLKAAELGSPEAKSKISVLYMKGEGVAQDEKKGLWYMEMAALGGCMASRHNLGVFELKKRRNLNRALRHWMIAAGAGVDQSLERIESLLEYGLASWAEYDYAIRAHQKATIEANSKERDNADIGCIPVGESSITGAI